MTLLKRIIIGWLTLAGLTAFAAFVVKRRIPAFGDEDDDSFSIVATMEGRQFRSEAASLTTAEVTAFAAGVELDLTGATIERSALLDLRVVMGGVDVIVPSSWRVEVAGRSVMGGVGNLTAPDAGWGNAPLLVVHADVIMGGVEIHATDAA
ncbi:MAG: hypothetical protein QNJ81_13845 [Acidimicrobiia bacterium]|nr:hypothetical protein [Acidimicrobiia bacterium]